MLQALTGKQGNGTRRTRSHQAGRAGIRQAPCRPPRRTRLPQAGGWLAPRSARRTPCPAAAGSAPLPPWTTIRPHGCMHTRARQRAPTGHAWTQVEGGLQGRRAAFSAAGVPREEPVQAGGRGGGAPNLLGAAAGGLAARRQAAVQHAVGLAQHRRDLPGGGAPPGVRIHALRDEVCHRRRALLRDPAPRPAPPSGAAPALPCSGGPHRARPALTSSSHEAPHRVPHSARDWCGASAPALASRGEGAWPEAWGRGAGGAGGGRGGRGRAPHGAQAAAGGLLAGHHLPQHHPEAELVHLLGAALAQQHLGGRPREGAHRLVRAQVVLVLQLGQPHVCQLRREIWARRAHSGRPLIEHHLPSSYRRIDHFGSALHPRA